VTKRNYMHLVQILSAEDDAGNEEATAEEYNELL
jgi:hypothetical protein